MGCANCTEDEGAEEGGMNNLDIIKEDTFGKIKIKVLLGNYTSAVTQAIVHPTIENFDDQTKLSKKLNELGGKPYRKILERTLNNYGQLANNECRSTAAGRKLKTFKYIIHVNGPDYKYLQDDK